MSAVVESPIPVRRSVEVNPTFWGALSGLWSLTWRSQTALRRIPHLVASILIFPILAYSTIDNFETVSYLRWTVDFYFLLILPLYCLSTCGGMIREEIQGDTLFFLTTRPLTRARFYILKYLCQIGWLQIVTGLSMAFLIVAGMARQIPDILVLGAFLFPAQILAVCAWGALSALLGLLTGRYIVLGIVYGFIVEIGIGRIPTNINSLSLTKNIQTLLANNEVLAQNYEWSSQGTPTSILILILASVLFVTAGAALFTFREYNYSDEAQKAS